MICQADGTRVAADNPIQSVGLSSHRVIEPSGHRVIEPFGDLAILRLSDGCLQTKLESRNSKLET
jgi:hypothetical protein